MSRGVTLVAAFPAVLLIFTPTAGRPTPPEHVSHYRATDRGTTGSLRATTKNTFSDGTAPTTSPHFTAMLQNRNSRSRHATQLRHMTAPPRQPIAAYDACALATVATRLPPMLNSRSVRIPSFLAEENSSQAFGTMLDIL